MTHIGSYLFKMTHLKFTTHIYLLFKGHFWCFNRFLSLFIQKAKGKAEIYTNFYVFTATMHLLAYHLFPR